MKIPATCPDSAIGILIDAREQQPFEFPGFQTEVRTLPTGDYALAAAPSLCCIERKASVAELAACVGRERERFERELLRLKAYPCRLLLIECGWDDIENPARYPGQVGPKHVIGSLISWSCRSIPYVLAGTRQRAEKIAADFLRAAYRHEYQRLRKFAGQVNG